jgi:uncharacterized protein YaiI (UPF0178 family)
MNSTLNSDAGRAKPTIYVDADGCPVKDEVYRVARKYELKVFVVCNSPMRVPAESRIARVVVGRALDAADIWIAEHVGAGDIVVTTDIPLADRCLKRGARVLDARGREFDVDSIGTQMATRDLMNDLRLMGLTTGGPPPAAQKDRSNFLAKLHDVIQALQRAAGA